MEEQVQSTESQSTGVESASVAGEQSHDTNTSVESTTGVETTEVAAQIKDEKDFSSALKARETQLRQQIEKEYGEKYKPYETHSQQLVKTAKFYGYDDVNEFMQAVEQAEQQRMIQEEAAKLGVDESVIRDHLSPLKQQLQQYESQMQQLKQQEAMRQIDAEVSQLKQKYPDFEKFQDAVFDMVVKGEVKSLEKGYLLASYDERINGVKSQTEQEVLARVTARDQKQVLPSNEGPSGTQFSIANASFEDIKKISQQVQAGAKIIP